MSAGPAIAPAVIAAVAGLGGALFGGFATYLTTSRLAEHQRALAVHERTQQRRGDTYVAIMGWVNYAQTYVDAAHGGLLVVAAPPLPAAPDGLADLPSRVRAYASARVAERTVELNRAFDGFVRAVDAYEAQRAIGAIPLDIQPVDRAHREVGRLGDELEDLIRSDLGVDKLPRGPLEP